MKKELEKEISDLRRKYDEINEKYYKERRRADKYKKEIRQN